MARSGAKGCEHGAIVEQVGLRRRESTINCMTANMTQLRRFLASGAAAANTA